MSIRFFNSRNKKILVIVLAVALIASSGSLLYVLAKKGAPAKNESATFGPKVSINILNTPDNFSSNNTTIVVQAFGLFPQNVREFQTIGANLTGKNQSNNGNYVELLNTTVDNLSDVLFLSPLFINVATAWRNFLSQFSGTNYPSLTVEATKSVDVNGTVQVYNYYNNLLFNPNQVEINTLSSHEVSSPGAASWFNGSSVNPGSFSSLNYTDLAFNVNLSFPKTPTQTLTNVSQPNASVIYSTARPAVSMDTACPGPGSYTYTYWATSSDTYIVNTGTCNTKGYLPMLVVHMGNGSANGHSQLSIAGAIILQDANISINSNQVYVSSSGQSTSSMSSTPSYEHAASASVETGIKSAVAYPLNAGSPKVNFSNRQNRTTAFVAIQNATYTFVHFSQYTKTYDNEYQRTVYYKYEPYYYDGKEYCREVIYYTYTTEIQSVYEGTTFDGNGTTGEVSSISSIGNIQVSAGFLDIEVNMVLHKLLASRPGANLTINAAGAGNSLSASTFWASDSAYTDASQVLKDAKAAMAVFSASLIEGLAITDTLSALNGATADASEPAIVSLTMGLVAAEIGLENAVLSDFSTIGFVSNAASATLTYGVSNYVLDQYNNGSNYSMVEYESQSYISMNFNGNSYQFYAPNDYLNATASVQTDTSTPSLQLSTPMNSSQSTSPAIYDTSGVWTLANPDGQGGYAKETAIYNIQQGSQYLAGSVFNAYQDFAFQPAYGSLGGTNYYSVGDVQVQLINAYGNVVASWSHNFNKYSNSSLGWVYVNPTFSIPNGSVQPITEIKFVNTHMAGEPYFTSTGNGGLIAFAEATANDNSVNNSQPENDETSISWFGYTTPSASLSWSVPSNIQSYTIEWVSPIPVSVTYNGVTQLGTVGVFVGSVSDSSLSAFLLYWAGSPQAISFTMIYITGS
ncbi:MAG: hypothetical protein ACYDAZ_01235 [Thermoplasmataceae archaeon]